MIYFLYSLITYLLLPFAFLRLYRKGKITPAYRERWSERKGICPFKFESSIWVHAVSLGESVAAGTLIKKLILEHPDTPIVVTTTTPTGSDYIKHRFGEQVHHCYFPYDLTSYMKRFINSIHPKALLLMETELWPNCLKALHEKKIPAILVNARLSEKSYLRYANFKSISHEMIGHLHTIIAQTDEDKARFEKLGKPKDGVHVTGSSKFDVNQPENTEQVAQDIKSKIGDRPTWVGASTHEGEEAYLLDAHRALLAKVPNALLIIVPRHPERFESVGSLIQQREFSMVSRSSGESCHAQTNVYLGNSMGELLGYYKASDVAFVGGSLVAVGGHNLLEASAMERPVLTGPYLHNFKLIAKTLTKHKAASIVHQPAELAIKLEKLFTNDKLRTAMGKAGLAVVDQNRGAFSRQYDIISKVLA